MDVTAIPFNKLIGLTTSDDERYLLMLPEDERFLNHVGTVHASALFALAEATSGMAMLGELGGRTDLGAVVRKVETKYRNPARGAVYSAALTEDKSSLLAGIDARGRGFAHVAVDLFDGYGKLVMRSEFEWFVTKITKLPMEIEVIQNRIYEIRGRRVMLDFDIAQMYGIETRVLKQAVRRNLKRFEGEDFMFEPTLEELSRSQFVTLNKGRGGNIKYLPFAFTELGVAMLSSVLNSDTATGINRSIMRAFVALRQLITTSAEIKQLAIENAEIRAKLELLERNDEDTLEAVNDLSEDLRKDIDNLYNAIGELSLKPVYVDKPRRPIGYNVNRD